MITRERLRERLKLTPINPFTQRQGQVLQGLADGKSLQEIADALGITKKTVATHLYGGKVTGEKPQVIKGVYNVVEEITGKRPVDKTQLITRLIGDVLLFEYKGSSSLVNLR